jgi:hypothetical protein
MQVYVWGWGRNPIYTGESVLCVTLPRFSPLFGAQIPSFLLPFSVLHTCIYNGAGISDLEKGVECYDGVFNFFGRGMPQAVE